MASEVSKAEAIADLQRVGEQLGHPPTIAEYRARGEYSPPTVARHFEGSFTAARAAALDCLDEAQAEHRRGELLADIERVAGVVGGEPARSDYESHGEYALSTITYRFDSWVASKREAGVYEGLDDGPTREELLADLRRVDRECSGAVSQLLYQEHGGWSKMTVQREFDSWEDGCQKAGVTRSKMGPRTEDTDELLKDIRRLADRLGRPSSKSEYNEMGEFTRGLAETRLGSWNNAVREAGFEPREPGSSPGAMNGNWVGGYEPYYGKDWNKQRRRARERDGYECVACEMTDEEHLSKYGWELEVHHIKPVRTFDQPEHANGLENLITLCRGHHREYEHLPNERAKELFEDL